MHAGICECTACVLRFIDSLARGTWSRGWIESVFTADTNIIIKRIAFRHVVDACEVEELNRIENTIQITVFRDAIKWSRKRRKFFFFVIKLNTIRFFFGSMSRASLFFWGEDRVKWERNWIMILLILMGLMMTLIIWVIFSYFELLAWF